MLSEAVLAGIRAFNAGRYFDAHDLWEEHWGLGPDRERKLLLGLIKAAVALHHLRNGNVRGFDAQLDLGLPHLSANADLWPDLPLAVFVEELASLQAAVRFHADLGELLAQVPMPTIPEPN